MDALRYKRAIDLNDTNNAHTLGVLSVPPGSRVLDVGCAGGHVGGALRERGCKVWGVDIDADAAAVAAASDAYERVVVADVESLDFRDEFADLEFDAVMLLDVLEHLREPEQTIRDVRPLLADAGRIVVSIPNVTHAALRLEVLSGRFRYREVGLLDRTHLRFFDRQGVEDLLTAGGFEAEEFLRVTRELDETEFDLPLDELPPEVLAAATAGGDAKTYQFVVTATPSKTSSPVGRTASARTASLAERLQAERDALKAEIEKSTRYVEHLEAHVEHLEAHYAQQVEQLRSAQVEEQAELQLEVGLLRNDLMVKEAYLAELRSQVNGRVPDAIRYRYADAVANTLNRIPGVSRSVRRLARKP